jgi:ribosome maturation factor RimP
MKEIIEDLVNKMLPDESYFIVDVLLGGSDNIRKISVLLDSDVGVNIDDCAKVSRKLGEQLEELNLVSSAYHLEVSSPGIDKPLKLKRQYQKNIGRQLSVMLKDTKIKTGTLEAVSEDKISLMVEEQDKANKKKKNLVKEEIPFSEIKKSNVIVSFK